MSEAEIRCCRTCEFQRPTVGLGRLLACSKHRGTYVWDYGLGSCQCQTWERKELTEEEMAELIKEIDRWK